MSIRKASNAGGPVYVVDEYVGILPNGKRDRRRIRCRTMADAKHVQAELVSERNALRGRSGRITLASYVARRLEPRMSGLAASSRDTYRRELRLRILPSLGDVDLREIDHAAVQFMVDACATESVARKALGLLHTVMADALSDGLVARNPCDGRFAMPGKGRKRGSGVVVGTFAEVARILGAVDAYAASARSPRHAHTARNVEAIAVTGFLLGLRPEERYALDWSEVDIAAGIVHVTQALTQVSASEGGVDLKEPKTENAVRDVPMPKSAADRLAMLRESAASPHVITSMNGGRVSPSTARHSWSAFLRWCDSEGVDVPPVTVENMRHSFATSFLHAGGNVEDLSRILGHADISTTFRRYVRPDTAALVDAVSRIVP